MMPREQGAHPARTIEREAELQVREIAQFVAVRRRGFRKRLALQAIVFVALLLVWWGISGRLVDYLFLSDPWSVAKALAGIASDGSLSWHLRYTLLEMTLGLAIGSAGGIVTATVVAMLPWGEQL